MIPNAYEGPENYIFISYAHADRDEVYKVLNELENNGYRFWYDDGIAPGSEWAEDIAKHLSRSAAVMAFITENSVKSQNCRREITYALSKEKPFVSVVLEETEMTEGLEMQLSAQQSVNKNNYPDWDRFINKLLSCPDIEGCKEPEPEVSEPAGSEPESKAEQVAATAEPVASETGAVPEAMPLSAEAKEKESDEKAETSNKKAAAKRNTSAGSGTKKKGSIRTVLIGCAALALFIIALAIIHPGSVKTSWGEEYKKSSAWIKVEEAEVTQSDIDKLAKIKNKSTIHFKNCDLSGCDLSPLVQDGSGTYAVELYSCTGLADYSFLEALTLRKLSITNAPEFTDISKLDMTEMEELNISGTGVTSIDAAAAAEELSVLNCSNCKIENVSSIDSLVLRELYLNGCGISDLSAFRNLTRLTTLDIRNNPKVTSMSWLDSQNYDTLEVLYLDNTGLDVSDLEFVKKCYNLTDLTINGISSADLSFCAGKTQLEFLSAAGCGIKDISSLKSCTKLKSIYLGFNEIGSIDGLKSLSDNSITLDLSFNKLSDVSSLPITEYQYAAILLSGNEKELAATVPGDLKCDIMTVDWYDGITKAPFAKTGNVSQLYIVDTPDSQKLNIQDSVESLFVSLVTMDELFLDLLPNDKLDKYGYVTFHCPYAELYKAR